MVSPENGGDVQVDGTSIISPFEKIYPANQNVQLKAVPAPGYYFAGWQGAITDETETVTISMTCPKQITAVFTSTAYQLKVHVNTTKGGQIAISPIQPNDIYPSGMKVTVTAVANEGYQFNKWTGDISSDEISIDIIMDGAKEMTANFTGKGTHSTSWWFKTIGVALVITIAIGLAIFLIIRIINIKQRIT